MSGPRRSLGPRALIACASLGTVLVLAYVDVDRTSPGPVAVVHGRIDDLEAGQNCDACHGGWGTSMTEACLECHAPIGEQIEAGAGLHGTLTTLEGAGVVRDPNACGRCHGEHHGEGFALVNPRAFALAGVPDVEAFDHTRVGWVMEGAHLALECSECHEHADAAPLAEGARRYGGEDQTCATCHEDHHDGAFAVGCATCHVQTGFGQHVAAGHERHLALTGGHAGLSCRACHAEGSSRSLEVLAGGGPRPSARGCADCHDSPHSLALVDGVAHAEGVPLDRACGVCHTQDDLSFRALAVTMTAAQHAFTGFPLEAPHALASAAPEGGLACASCHDPELPTFVARYPGRRALDCNTCHDDPHGGQFQGGPFADPTLTGGGCVTCHAPTGFAPHGFDLGDHARAAFAVDGAHAELQCDACHVVPGDGGPRRFAGTPARCEACHEDAHEGGFARRAAELAAASKGTCARCHGTASFDASLDFAAADHHGHFTGFALDGAHAEARCEACHAPSAAPDRFGRLFGRAADAYPSLAAADGAAASPRDDAAAFACARCHADPHGGVFRDADSALGALGVTDCARCHEETSFRASPRGFDHGAATGFPLAGAHAAAACAACHAPLAEPDPTGRTTARVLGSRCVDCHADPHGGQFHRVDRVFPAGGTDCARCHEAHTAFRASAFDHEWDSTFPLEGSHERVACAACHRAEEVQQDGAAVTLVRYRPLPQQCVDCHGEQAGALRRRAKGRNR